jgi:hypothetical protein
MDDARSVMLAAAGTASLLIAILQFVMYFGGPDVYRACGTPEAMIDFYVSSPVAAFIVEVCIAGLFVIFAAYGFSGATFVRPLPRLWEGIAVTTAIYLLRGMVLVAQLTWQRSSWQTRDRIYSSLALLIGIAYGLPLCWRH